MKKMRLLAWLLAVCLLLSGCDGMVSRVGEESDGAEVERVPVAKVAPTAVGELPLEDDSTLYEAYDPTDPLCFYLTVVKGSAADETDHTLAEVNSYLNLQGMTGVEKIKAEVIFQVGDETGPLPGEMGYAATASNATINVRGRTSTGYPQKSYRISLFDSAGLWRGQRAIAINKHPADVTRLRNVLYFRLLQDVPGMTSLRTQFVHVYVKDKTDPDAPDAFVDYGLYTQVELPNGRFLRNHGLSQNGNLYKANMCEMYRYEDQLRLATDPEYSLEKFSEVLEPKTGNDHTKLLEMLDAVNDYTIPIEQVIEKYFDLDNLTSYMAFNMLLDNPDSNAQNYLLYSPVSSDTWYYLCWDGDGALKNYENELLDSQYVEAEWTKGVSCYWGVVLFNRMLRIADYREALKQKAEALHQSITPERIAQEIAKYRTVVDQYTSVMPDAVNMKAPSQQRELIYQNMPYDTDKAYEKIMDSFEKPMPFFLDDVIAQDGKIKLSWLPAFDFDGEFIRYDVEVATDWDFAKQSLVCQSLGQLDTSAEIPILAEGTYYWRAVAVNESGKSQMAFDQVITSSGAHGGMRRFTVGADGRVSNPE